MPKKFGGKIGNISDTNLLLTITVVVFFLMYIGAMIFQGEGFLKPQALFNILNANAALIILSCGMSIVMITGGIDISVGGVTALISMCCAVYLDKVGGSVPMAVLIALLIGLGFGLIQGWLVAYLEIQPFIVTLAGMFFARGMTTIVNTEPFNVANEAFVALKNTRIIVPGMGSVNRLGKYVDAYVEIGVIVAILVVIVLFCVLKWTKLGRSFYAVGGNEKATKLSGINTDKVYFIAYTNMGLLAALAGMLTIARMTSAQPTYGQNYEMDAIGSCFIGGASAYGGVGTVPGVIIGAVLMGVINMGMSIMGVDANYQRVVKGLVLLAAVIFDVVSKRKNQ